MIFDQIELALVELISNRYEIDNDSSKSDEYLSYANEKLQNSKIIRVRRLGVATGNWKTLVFAELDSDNYDEIKINIRQTTSWIASIKETLDSIESTDLYLFLAFTNYEDQNECMRIESTEQFCRKYVVFPNETIDNFLGRTFLQKCESATDTSLNEDPLEKSFTKTILQHTWLTKDTQNKWRKAFSELSGSDLADALLENEDNI